MSVGETESSSGPAQSSQRSRLPRCNSVEVSDGRNRGSEESGGYDAEVVERATECVERFRENYPDLAGLPLSRKPGRELRVELVEEEYREEYVEPAEEWEQGHVVHRLDRAESVTWADALFTFLVTRQKYDDGLAGRFVDTVEGEEFTKRFHDCWTTEYGEKQAARNRGAQRQLMGGQYPENEESALSGECAEGEWSDQVATIMLTRTGSSVPDGRRISPVDHADAVARAWSKGGVYQTVRNICEYHLGLESDEWGYVRGDDVHGMGAFEHEDPGENACYVHSHEAIYIDLEATGLTEEFDTDFEIKSVLEAEFYRAIEKHLEVCEIAGREAHTRENAVRVRLDLENPADYATEYLRLDEREMMDMPVEFQAFAAVEWGTNRQRIARSKLFTDAAKADLCKQDPEREHAERLTYRRGHGDPEVVCACCSSGVGIDAETITEYRLNNEPARLDELDELEDGEGLVGYSVGESFGERDVRVAVEEYVDLHGSVESVSMLMGQLEIEPKYRDLVESVVSGEAPDPDAARAVEWGPEPPGPEARYQLEALVLPDGGEEEVSGGGGGARTVGLMLPEERLLRETRLSLLRGRGPGGPAIVVSDNQDRSVTYEPETAATWLVERGYREPWHAELVLSFDTHGRAGPSGLSDPMAEPPPGLGVQS